MREDSFKKDNFFVLKYFITIIFDTVGTKNILHVSVLRLLSKAAFPGIPMPDVWLQISPAL